MHRRDLLGAAGALLGAGAFGACASQRRVGSGARPSEAGVAIDARSSDRSAAEAERFADLTDQTKSATPIGAADRARRRERLRRSLNGRFLDAFVCEGGPTLDYLTGVSWGRSERLFAYVVTASDLGDFWICPAFEESRARALIEAKDGPGGAIVTWPEDEYAFRPLVEALRTCRVMRVAVDPGMRFGMIERAKAAASTDPATSKLEFLDDPSLLVELRGRKEPAELALLRRASELTKLALVRVAEELRPAMDGPAVGALVAAAHRKLGFSSSWCLPLVGPAAALPHGDAGKQTLGDGDVLLVDCGGSFLGYQSDVTRTWVPFGAPSVDVARAWHDVRDAQRAAFDVVRPGARCRDVDAAARGLIAARGWPGGFGVFTHRLGHGIGLEGHEDPYFDGGSDVELAPGMTLTNEPGIYLPGRFGVRIEDVVHVVDRGAEVLGDWQRDVRSPASA